MKSRNDVYKVLYSTLKLIDYDIKCKQLIKTSKNKKKFK